MKYTLGQAAIAADKAKGTISNAIKNGRISAEKKDDGSYSIDPSELHRVFPLKNLDSTDNRQNERSETPGYTRGLELENEFLKQRVAELLSDRQHDRDQVERMHELYKDAVQRLEPPKPRGWLSWLRGDG